MNEVAVTQYSLSLLFLNSVSSFSPLAHWDRESEQVLNMVLCVYIHMQVSAKIPVYVDTLNTTTTFEPLTVIIMNNLAFCQLALKSEPAGSSFCQNG